jgi:hypothetical protein
VLSRHSGMPLAGIHLTLPFVRHSGMPLAGIQSPPYFWIPAGIVPE